MFTEPTVSISCSRLFLSARKVVLAIMMQVMCNGGNVPSWRAAMRKIVLMLMLAVVSNGATAEWVEIYRGGDETLVADPTTSARTGDKVQMWDMGVICVDCDNVQTFGSKRYSSRTRHAEYDCKEERMRTVYATGYAGNADESRKADFASGPTEWLPVARGTAEEALWKFACGKL
jgi:hypothetical protein